MVRQRETALENQLHPCRILTEKDTDRSPNRSILFYSHTIYVEVPHGWFFLGTKIYSGTSVARTLMARLLHLF